MRTFVLAWINADRYLNNGISEQKLSTLYKAILLEETTPGYKRRLHVPAVLMNLHQWYLKHFALDQEGDFLHELPELTRPEIVDILRLAYPYIMRNIGGMDGYQLYPLWKNYSIDETREELLSQVRTREKQLVHF